jgi:hypothetical protein
MLPAVLTANKNGVQIDADQLVKRSLQDTVQEFPPAINAGAFLIGESVRGPILPAYGTKERDRILRIYDQMEFNNIWQGAIAGLIKKLRSTPWEIRGDPYWANYYTAIFHHAQFGKGWGEFIALLVRDFLTQDYGGFIELIGPGDPDGPITGPLGDPWRDPYDPRRYVGLAYKDAWRCFVTGNPTWPVIYYSLMTGKLHRMHHSRIRRIVDMPNPDERYFGIGLCALSRCIGVASREIRLGRYIDAFLDDKPKPGILTFSGILESQAEAVIAKMMKRQAVNDGDPLGKMLRLHSLDVDHPIKVESIPFAQTPEKFDFTKYVDLDVNSIALGLGVDRQELWELAGKGIGSGAQSSILAQKAEGKAYGDLLQTLERVFNLSVLPAALEFRFKPRNTVGDTAQSEVDGQYATVAATLAAIPNMTNGAEMRRMLASRSQTFSEAFTNEQGSVELEDSDVQAPDQEVSIQDDAPAEDLQKQPLGEQAAKPTGQPEGTPPKPSANESIPQKQKDLATDAQRRWFFAHNPEYAAQGGMPAFSPGADRETHRQQLQQFAETSKNRVANHLWDHELIAYNDQAQVVVNADKTRASAKSLMDDTRDAQYPRKYLVEGARDLYGIQGDDKAVESRINREKAAHAQAVIVAAHVGDVKLTDAQTRYMHSVAQGNYLSEKYSQYASGDRGTLQGVSHGPISRRSGDRFQSAAAADFDKMRYEWANKEFQDTRDEFIASLIDLITNSDKESRRRFGVVFRAQLRRSGTQAFKDVLEEAGVAAPLDDDDQAQIQHWLIRQSEYVSDFANQVYQKGLSQAEIDHHAEMWANKSLQEIANAARISADRNSMYEWVLGRTEKHCKTCERLEGQRHRYKEWYARNLTPRSSRLDCNGFRCDCKLVKTTEPARGRF